MNTIHLSAFVVTLLLSYLIPLATAVMTKMSASTTLKQIVSAFLAAVTGFLTNATMQDGTAVFSQQALLFATIAFITANIAYVGTWKPHAIDIKLLPTKGLGR